MNPARRPLLLAGRWTDGASWVEVRAPWGHDGLGAPWQDGDGWHALLTAPSAPGETVVEVWVDGAPLPIRPRVSWD